MAKSFQDIKKFDPVWDKIIDTVKAAMEREPLLGPLINSNILHHNTFECSCSYA